MDRDQTQYGSLGFIGIYRETFRIIFTWKKIFSQITLALILPLCFLSLAHSNFTELFFGRHDVSYGQSGNGRRVSFYLFEFVYLIIVLLLSLLSTAAVVYTIACIYANKDHTFRKVMSVVPKAWKRLLITFLWSSLIYFVFAIFSIMLLFGCVIMAKNYRVFGIVLLVIWLIAFVVSYLYIAVFIQVAYVVSILEDDYGRKAISKGRALVKGKICAAAGCYLVILVLVVVVELVFEVFVVSTSVGNLEIWLRILIGLAILVVVVFLYLVELVYSTVIYFVCKSYHNEHIDGPALEHHLEGYSRIKDVQLEPASRVSIHV